MHTHLQAILAAIPLGEPDILALHATLLPPEGAELAALLRAHDYPQAAEWIQTYQKTHHALAQWQDPTIPALRLQLEALEKSVTTLAADKADMERQITAFNVRLYEIAGDALQALLHHAAEQAQQNAAATPQDQQKQQQAEQTRAEWQEFEKNRQMQPKVAHLNEDEQAELKRLYRRAAMKCHPDRLPPEQQAAGTALFQELQQANREQNLPKMREISQRLQAGDWRAASATLATQGDPEALQQRIDALRAQETALRQQIAALEQDAHWQTITRLKAENRDWDDYLHELKADFQTQLQNMQTP